jgi:hypothetical protein
MSARQRLSGAAYKKIRERKEANATNNTGTLNNYFIKSEKQNQKVSAEYISSKTKEPIIQESDATTLEENVNYDANDNNSDDDNFDCLDKEEDNNFDDPHFWPSFLDESTRIMILKKGPIQKKLADYPINTCNRKFSNAYYERTLKNGETYERTWLVYSVKNDSAHCFCCIIFNKKKCETGMGSSVGYDNWKNLSQTIQTHEKSKNHHENFSIWQDILIRLKLNKTIDCCQQKLFNEEIIRWRSILTRLCAVLRVMAVQNMALRGPKSTINTLHNGNFLKLIECFGLFDNVIKEHLKTISCKPRTTHYLGPRIQNELIAIMSQKIKSEIINMLNEAKYFSLILDCTPDIGHIEQMSIIVRFVRKHSEEVREHFLGFIEIDDKTGAGLAKRIVEELENLNINIHNMRGQSL